jgi:hypothetical protein
MDIQVAKVDGIGRSAAHTAECWSANGYLRERRCCA